MAARTELWREDARNVVTPIPTRIRLQSETSESLWHTARSSPTTTDAASSTGVPFVSLSTFLSNPQVLYAAGRDEPLSAPAHDFGLALPQNITVITPSMLGNITLTEAWLVPYSSNHAELPVWDEQSQCLYWVDMEPLPAIHRVLGFDSKAHTGASFPDQDLAGGVFIQEGAGGDELIVGSKLGWGTGRFDAARSEVADYTELANVTSVTPAQSSSSWKPIRLNEATSDPLGRIWFATCAEGESDVKPALYLLDPKRKSLVEIPCAPAELTMPNAMVIYRDCFYLGCSERGTVWKFKLNLHASEPAAMLRDGQLFLEIEKPAVPDGMTVDSHGNLYLAVFNAGEVQVFSPHGERLQTISLPAQAPTCTVFAGPDLDELIITTHAVTDEMRQMIVDAGQAKSVAEVRRRWPQGDGALFRVKLPGVRGVTKPRVRA